MTRNGFNSSAQNNADGGQIGMGVVARILTWLGANITFNGTGTSIHTFPSTTDTLAGIGTANVFTVVQAFNLPICIKAGASTGNIAKAGGVIFNSFTDSSVGGAETDIYTNTLPASIFNTNADKVLATYAGNFVTVGTELTQLKVKFAGTTIWDSTALAPATGTTSWRVSVEIIRVSASVIRYTVSLNTSGASGYVYCTTGELTGLTLTNTNILKITGTSSGVGFGVGDIIGKLSSGQWLPAI